MIKLKLYTHKGFITTNLGTKIQWRFMELYPNIYNNKVKSLSHLQGKPLEEMSWN